MISLDLFPELDETQSDIDFEIEFKMTLFNEEGFLEKDAHRHEKKETKWKVFDNNNKKWRYIEPDLLPLTYALFNRPTNILEEHRIYEIVKNMPRNRIIWSDCSKDVRNALQALCSYNRTWFGRFTWEPANREHKSGGCFVPGWKNEKGKMINKMSIQIEIKNKKIKIEGKSIINE